MCTGSANVTAFYEENGYKDSLRAHFQIAVTFTPYSIKMSTPTWPWLPVEIIRRIIFEAWSMPLSAYDRTTFIAASIVTSKAWRAAFVEIATKDVRLPNPPACHQLFRTLREEDPLYNRDIEPSP